MRIKDILLKLNNSIFSTYAAGIYLLIFAVAIGAATFVENDFGTSSAQDIIFRARWFELLLVLFSGTIISNIFRFNMVQQKKWAALMFHSAIVVIIIGAGVTRYFGYEGMMNIREGQASNSFLSTETFLNFRVSSGGKSYTFEEPVYFSTLGNHTFEGSYQIGTNVFQVNVTDFIPNPKEQLTEQPNGQSVMKVVVAGKQGREEIFVKKGDKVNINGVNFNFTEELLPNAFNVTVRNDSLYFSTDAPVIQTVMATQKTDTIPASDYLPLKLKSMYVLGGSGFVIGDFKPSASMSIVAGDQKMKNESPAGLSVTVTVNGQTQENFVVGQKGVLGQPKIFDFNPTQMAISYGSKIIEVPFSIQLRDFIMERYPGTDNPSSYASEVTVVDPANGVNMPFRIFMNNILDYGGYRFFQSSFDQDEQGTYLSVNHDFWGTWISYIGYILLTIGMMMTFFSKNSRFTSLVERLGQHQQIKNVVFILCMFLMGSFGVVAQAPVVSDVSKEEATAFGKMLIQDHRGRFKPVNTLSGEVLRKLSKKSSLYGLTSDQIFLSMTMSPAKWENVPLIHTGSHPELQKILGASEKLISYRQFFTEDAQYKLREQIRAAQSVNPKDQGTFEKAIIKLDEKINIANMIFSGRLLKMFPVPNNPANTWVSPADVREMKMPETSILQSFENFAAYIEDVQKGQGTSNTDETAKWLNKISATQIQYSSQVMPSNSRVNAELLLNQLDVFGRLRNVYAMLSLILLGLFFYGVFNHSADLHKYTRWTWYLLLAVFAFHTLGLGLRWYVSGRAPWSNGYESMIYISWTTMLAGLIFSRRSLGGMSATLVLAATILLVAGMSWLDPEITPLVPVLKSYWLTIHVSLEAGSYGFLMLGAVIGMLNLILMIFTNARNKEHTERTIKELTIISEITLLGGLFMVSVGTYLGGVWANESWGRYWGWDAKETWALVTILVYAFILHMRFIPGLRGVYAFNFASLFGFATVIMTYFGVNYYLSGLHSYAAGDPVPIPPGVYYTALVLTILSILAYLRWIKVK
ncbi:MAG: cytochrome c biogenesis protein CcsA [Saprospiraceae bacterium]|nr:cytochrome c biogenesis protein CcsA [Saprospiraceae bacterium]